MRDGVSERQHVSNVYHRYCNRFFAPCAGDEIDHGKSVLAGNVDNEVIFKSDGAHFFAMGEVRDALKHDRIENEPRFHLVRRTHAKTMFKRRRNHSDGLQV